MLNKKMLTYFWVGAKLLCLTEKKGGHGLHCSLQKNIPTLSSSLPLTKFIILGPRQHLCKKKSPKCSSLQVQNSSHPHTYSDLHQLVKRSSLQSTRNKTLTRVEPLAETKVKRRKKQREAETKAAAWTIYTASETTLHLLWGIRRHGQGRRIASLTDLPPNRERRQRW